MKKQLLIITSFIIAIALAGFTLGHPVSDNVAYPEGYRKWTHVKSTMLGPEHPNVKYRGFNHIYANEKALTGYETGVFPDGAVIVFDVIEVKSENNQTNEDKRNHIDVMVKDSRKYPATGGWNFGQFEADKTPRNISDEVKTRCFNCHTSQKDYVFSEFRQ